MALSTRPERVAVGTMDDYDYGDDDDEGDDDEDDTDDDVITG